MKKEKKDKQLLIKHNAENQRTCHTNPLNRARIRFPGSVGSSCSIVYFTNTLQVLSLIMLHSSSSQLSIFSSYNDTNTYSSQNNTCLL